jgi:hypothetical protein
MLLTVWEDFETAAERLYLQDPMKVKRNLSLSFAQPNVGLKLIILSCYYSLVLLELALIQFCTIRN